MGNLFDTKLIISCHIIYDLLVVILYRNNLTMYNENKIKSYENIEYFEYLQYAKQCYVMKMQK